AAFAILLAATGLYGVIAYNMSQRTREIGVRIALGAEGRHVIQLVAQQGLTLVGVGIALGVLASSIVLRVPGSLLFGASPVDVPVFAGVSLLLGVVAMGAI